MLKKLKSRKNKKQYTRRKHKKLNTQRNKIRQKYGGAAAAANNEPPPAPVLHRSDTYSCTIYNSLFERTDERITRPELFKSFFNNDTKIIPQLYKLLPVRPEYITVDLNIEPDRGVYINWKDNNGRQLLHLSVHTGMYKPGSTKKNVDTCVEKGNMHVIFDCMPEPNLFKLTVSDEMIVSLPHDSLINSLPIDEPRRIIVNKIIELLQAYNTKIP
jgi:hypothetical protein